MAGLVYAETVVEPLALARELVMNHGWLSCMRGLTMSDEIKDNPSGANAEETPDAPLPNEAAAATPSSEAINPELAKLALRKVKDPELGLNIVDLGLVYDIIVDANNNIHVDMTLTSRPAQGGLSQCRLPAAQRVRRS